MFLHPSATSEHHAPFLCLRRGVSTPPDRDDLGPQLFSAYAEVFPRFVSPVFLIIPFLCLRRGVSQHRFPWGCDQQLFSAYAEVFPLRKSEICSTVAFLCLRRGVSPPSSLAVLRLWLFSAYAEVFPLSVRGFKESMSFLCLRRGVSNQTKISGLQRAFSLPTQRCFRPTRVSGDPPSLFSAYAEVFPSSQPLSRFVSPFLCLRRGVSADQSGNGC